MQRWAHHSGWRYDGKACGHSVEACGTRIGHAYLADQRTQDYILVVNPVARPNDGLALPADVPGHTETRADILMVAVIDGVAVDRVDARLLKPGRGRPIANQIIGIGNRGVIFVTQAQVHGHVRSEAPNILGKS